MTSKRVTSPPSSSMATRTSSRSERSRSVRAESCSGEVMLRPNSPTEARPSPTRRSSQSGAVVPVNPGWSTASASRVRVSVVETSVVMGPHYPFTAPEVRPAAIFFWMIMKNTTTGMAIMVDAAMRAP